MNKKLKKSFITLMIFLVLITSITAISAIDNDSINETLQSDDAEMTLENPIDDEILSDESDLTFTDLNNNITGKTEVDLESNYVYSNETDSALKDGITVNSELKINGNGKTLNPNGNLLFNIGTDGKLTLKDLNIENTYTAADAMIKNSGTLILDNVTFTVERHILSSVATNSKFITIENNGEMKVLNSLFKDSLIYSDHISSTSKNLYIYGLIYNKNNILIENTVFDNNKLYNPTSNKMGRTIDICAILHNTANMTVNNVIIQNTNVSYVPAGNSHFEGIVFNEKGKLVINETILKDNFISFTTTNSNFKGVVYSEATDSELIISNSIITNNTNINNNAEKAIIEYKGTGNLDNNYWGTNNPDFSKLISGTAPGNFVVLGFTPEELTAGVEKTFEITLNTVNASGAINNLETGTLPNYNITVSSKKLGDTQVEIKNGVGEYKYLPINPGEDTITINGEEYTILVNAAPAGNFTELNTTIDENSVVDLYKNYTYTPTDSALQTGIPINKEVTINGNGYTISSSGSRLFNIGSGGKLTLKNVILLTDYAVETPASNGNIINNGVLNLDCVTITNQKTHTKAIAATILNKGTLSINNSQLIDSVSNYTGATTGQIPYGFIYNHQSATAIIENTLISNNKIETNGRIPSAYGLIYNYRGNLKLNNVNFTDNCIIESSTANTGVTNLYGLIYSNGLGTAGTIVIDNCKFENTKIISATGTATSKMASAIYSSMGVNLNISNSKFINNNIESDHGTLYGAIYTGAPLKSSNNLFENNTGKESGAIYSTKAITSEKDIFRGNTANNVIYTTAATTISNSIFEDNVVSGYVIYNTSGLNADNNYWGTNTPDLSKIINGGIPDNYMIITIEGETNLIPESKATYTVNFKTNDTNEVKELPDYKVDLTATNALSENSVVISNGSASFVYTSSLEEINDTIKASVDSVEKAALTVAVQEDPDVKGTYSELDRFIRKSNGELDLIKDYTFDSTIDAGLENGISIDKALTINGHGFTINSTDLARLFTVESTGNLTLKDVNIVSGYNVTGSSYGNVRPQTGFINNGILAFDNVTFTLSQNVTSTDSALAAGIYNSKTFTVANSKFVNSNIATNTQNCYGLIDNSGTLNIKDTLFDNNVMIESSTKSSIYANGLIYNMGTLTLDNINVTNNYMKTPNTARGLIRGYTNSKIIINNSLFENNTLESASNNAQGTVIFADNGEMSISNSKFVKNTGALSGGAIYTSVTGAQYYNNTFEKNTANGYGGAIYSSGTQAVFVNNTFKENNAQEGGALYTSVSLQAQKSYYFTGNAFIDNKATKNGGAIYAGASIGSTSYPIENNVFINNHATGEEGTNTGKGGAIYSTGTLRIIKTIFQENVAKEGAAAYTTGSSASLIEQSIFDNNVITSPTGTLIYYRGGSTANNNYWGTNSPDNSKIIAVSGGTLAYPSNFVLLTIEGNETLTASDVYILNFKNNDTGDIVELPDYAFDLTSNINSVNPTSVVLIKGESNFEYIAANGGQDTITALTNNAAKATMDITVDLRKTPEFSIAADNVTYGDALNFTFTITEGPQGSGIYKWTIFSGYGIPMETGYIDNETKEIAYTKTYSAGNYTIEVSISDVEGWKDLSVSDKFEIKQKQTEINATVKVNDDNSVEIIIIIQADGQTVNATGNVNVTIDENYGKEIEEGIATIKTNVLANGTYTPTLKYTGDANYIGTDSAITITIKNIVPESSLDLNGSSSDKPTFAIQLPKDAEGNLTVTINGNTISKELENGSANVTFDDLKPGNYTATVTYTGDKNYNAITKEISVNVPKKEIPGGEDALNVTSPEGSDSPSYSINLPSDATGNLTVTVDGVNYTQALVNGSATVNVPKLSPGNHNITVAYSGDENYTGISKTINWTVSEPVIKITKNKDISMLYSAKSPYKVLVTVNDKAVGAGEIVIIKFNGKTYKQKTDKNGYATLKLPDAKPKKAKYTITAEYKGVKVSNKVKVNSIVQAKNLKVKKSKKVNKIKVTLKKVNGKFLKGKTLKLKIKGKTVKAKTNKKGVATFKVKKNILKKLKVGKKYKYTVTYGKDTVSKKLTIKK